MVFGECGVKLGDHPKKSGVDDQLASQNVRRSVLSGRRLDTIFVAASARDARFTRICVASIRHFYPTATIKLLVGGKLEDGLANELSRYWDVRLSDVPPGEWGWGFVKLEPLFGREGEQFLVLDSDTAFGGAVLQHWQESSAPFLVDDEQQSEADINRLYYDWTKVAAIDRQAQPPQFLFNSGQWFGTAGLLRRKDFERFLDWNSMPPKARLSGLFQNGDQGMLNYVLNQRAHIDRQIVERRKIMCWPGNGMETFTAQSISQKTAEAKVIHWAGFKRARLGELPGADILRFFEAQYYAQLPKGTTVRVLRRARYPTEFSIRKVSDKLAYRLRKSK